MESSDKSRSQDRDNAQINGRSDAPKGSDDTNPDVRQRDNLHRHEQENSANGMDSADVVGGQDGRNIRAVGSTDMDSENGLLRLGDQDNSTMEVTDKGLANAASEVRTSTSTASVTTAGPDDYASDAEVGVPSAQEDAKKQGDDAKSDDESAEVDDTKATTVEEDEDVAETGTSINHQPTY